MSPLANAIQAESLSGTAEQIKAALQVDVTLRTDGTSYTWSGLSEKLVENGVDPQVVAGMGAVVGSLTGGDMLDRMLSSGGVNFAKPVIREMLAAAAQAAPQFATVITAMLSIGIATGPRWQRMGLPALPTDDDIAAAVDSIALSRKWEQVKNELVPSMLNAGASWSQIKTAIAEIG